MMSQGSVYQQLDGSQLDSMSKRWFFTHAINYTAVPAGSSQTGTARIEAGTSFICDALNFGAYYSLTNNQNTGPVRGQKISRVADVGDVASFTSAHIGMITLEIATQQRPWMDAPVRADLITGEPGRLFLLPTPIIVAPYDVITCKLTNNLDVARFTGGTADIDAQLTFIGQRDTIQPGQRR